MPATVEAKELGTLIVVVGKARNLVNKSRFGKQDPFCTVQVGEERQKTKPIKRGGQHPEWDEELRFTIVEDLDDVLVRSESQPDSLNSSLNGAPAPLPKDTPVGVITSAALANKSRKGPLGKKGGKSLKVACYADDAKEPELIGEAVVKIDEVLKKGEVDEWYEFLYKEKYSGEIYLELTFYSNDVPPVRRNVPRPTVHHYGSSGNFQPSPAGSLSSLAGKNKTAGGALTTSGSVSGMSLYIPPYMQQGRTSPAPQVPPSNSFADLGLPPGHRPGHQPLQTNQPTYPPSQPSTLSVHSSSSIDALTRPMSSMSLGQSYPSQQVPPPPAPGPSQPSNASHGLGGHRHSLGGGPSDAPWSSMLPQVQPAPAPTPHPRPMSTNDVLPWEQAHRLEHERLVAGGTPLPRPVSDQGQILPTHQQYAPHHRQSLSGIDHRVPSPIPEALRPAGPPEHTQHYPARSHSFSQALPAPINPMYPSHSPAPAPPPHSNSAPSVSPSTSNHYQLPTSSFSTLTQPVADPNRAPSPGPSYYHPQQPQDGKYHDPAVQQPPPQSSYQPSYQTPTGRDTYPPQPPGQAYQQTPPQAQAWSSAHPQSSQPPYQATPPQPQSTYSYNQASNSPPRPLAAAPSQPSNDGGYVPWYQQTQSTVPTHTAPPPVQPAHDQYGGQQYAPPPQSQYDPPPPARYTTPLPPPVPHARPQPVGYYPSDELYLQQQPPRQDAQTPAPQAPWQSHQSRPSYDQQASYDSQRQQAFSPVASSTYSPAGHQQPPYQGVPPPSPPRQPSWQQSQQYAPPPSQTPVPPNHYPQQPPPAQSTSYQNDYRAASPHPPYDGYGRAPSPHPPAQYGQAPPQPQYGQAPVVSQYGRSPSPQPPVAVPAQNYQPPYPAQGSAVGQLAPPSSSPLTTDAGRAPSPTPSGTSVAKTNWRSYMAGLNSTSGNAGGNGPIPARTPSPQPPPKDEWYTPPPSLPNSIAPPDGWRSTLPAQTDGHRWRG